MFFIRLGRVRLNRKARPAAAGRLGLGVVHTERGADEIVDEIDLGAREVVERDLVDQHGGAVAGDDGVVISLRVLHVEPVLETGAAAALDAHPQHAAGLFLAQDRADLAGRAVGDGDFHASDFRA